MAVFEESSLEWEGKKYTISPEGMLRAICEVEDVLSYGALAQASIIAREAPGELPLGKMSRALAIFIRHGGGEVSGDQIFGALFKDRGKSLTMNALQALLSLQALMIPPEHLRGKPGKSEAATARARPSRKRTSSS
jgi:hypothetical protein